jgi:hypothetical protein
MIHSHSLSIAKNDSFPLAQHNSPYFTATGIAKHTMIHKHWLTILHHDSQQLA